MRQYLPRRSIAQSMGGAYSQIMRTLAYWGAINSIIIIVLGWDSSMGTLVRNWFPWMSFGWFMGFVFIAFILVSLVDLFLILPTVIAFNNRQGIKHDNPVWKKMIRIEKKVDRIASAYHIDISDIDVEDREHDD